MLGDYAAVNDADFGPGGFQTGSHGAEKKSTRAARLPVMFVVVKMLRADEVVAVVK
jgi:hypothetical protein